MRVAVELRNIHFGASGGIAPLVRGVLGAAMRLHPDVEFTVFATLFNAEFFGPPLPNVDVRVLPLHSYWPDLAAALHAGSFDVLFRPYPGQDAGDFPRAREVVLIPDVQHDEHPEFFGALELVERRRLFASALRGAGAIGTISAFARASILSRADNECDDVFLMPPASQLDAHATNAVGDDFAARVAALSPFLLYPANLWPHKNHARLLAAFKRCREEARQDLRLVLTGHVPPDGERPWRGEPGVAHLGFVSRAELRHLYRSAHALVFPSLYEGFGMPLVEAFENACPVACGNVASLPEVAGGAALLFDPADVTSMADALKAITTDAGLRASLVQRGRLRAGAYSWERSAGEWIDACRRVASRVPRAARDSAQPLVSIVTPSFNQGRFLRRTLDSVLAQEYPHIELIVTDGGSTDDSVAILQSYGTRIGWHSEKDRGQAHAINKGMARARGSILAYLNSDDTLARDAVGRVVRWFAEDPACDLLYGDADYIDESDNVIGRYNTAPYSFARLMQDCCVCQPAAFWRSSIAARTGPFDETLDFVMDYDYWLRIALAGGNIRFVPERLANSRLHPATKTLSRRRDIYREIFAVCRRHGGYVDLSYYHGYWDHRVRENPGAFGRAVGVFPRGAALAARIHHGLDHVPGSGWPRARNAAKKGLGAFAGRIRGRGSLMVAAPAKVRGFYLDGWLGPRADMRGARETGDAVLFVSGRPAVACVVDVLVDGVKVDTQALAPDDVQRIEIRAPVRREVSLRFSAHVADAAQRRLAFLVLATNLFSERDLSA